LDRIDDEYALEFLTAGKCECSIESKKTEVKFTYVINKNKDKENMFFINVDKGYLDFIYAGVIFLNNKNSKKEFEFFQGKSGNYTKDSISIKALLYILNSLLNGRREIGVNIYNLGTCGRCGRPLTDPESIKRGLGPTCASRV